MSDYIAFKLWGSIILVLAFGIACFVYRVRTGKDLREWIRDHQRPRKR